MLLCGSGALGYGGLFHTALVCRQQERESSIPVPTLFGLGDELLEEPLTLPEEPSSTEGVDPFRSPPEKPVPPQAKDAEAPLPSSDVTFMKVTEKYWEARQEPEWTITRKMSVGGLTRLANGQLRRTYSGKPLSLYLT